MLHADKFQPHIYAAIAEQERDLISKRTKATLQMAKERGGTWTPMQVKRVLDRVAG